MTTIILSGGKSLRLYSQKVISRLAAKKGKEMTHGREQKKLRYGKDVLGHSIRDETDLIKHIDTIHFNPVKHG